MTLDEPITLAEIVESLGDLEAEARRRAAARLPDLEPAVALPLLQRVLGDVDWRVRKEAAKAARSFSGQQELVDALIATLAARDDATRDNVGLRNTIVEVLSHCGDAAVRAVSAALGHLDADGRKLAVEILGRSGSPKALFGLTTALNDADPNVREAALEAIASLGPAAPEPVRDILLAALEDRDVLLQLAALEGLSRLGVVIPWQRLAGMLCVPALRSAALSAAALVDEPEPAAAAIVEALGEAPRGSFQHALAALVRMADSAGPEVVSRALAARPEVLESAVAVARGEHGDDIELRASGLRVAGLGDAPSVVDVAVRALDDEPLADQAHRTLSSMGPRAIPRIIEILAASRRHEGLGREPSLPPPPSTDTRALLIELITHSAEASLSDRAIIELRREARSESGRIASAALFALSSLGDASDLALVAELATSEVGAVASAAALALAALARRHPVAARELCREAMKSESTGLAAAILIGALSDVPAGPGGGPVIDTDAARAFLRSAVTADDPRTRGAAVEAVALLGGPATVEVLTFALADEERRVQISAARALGRLWPVVGSELLAIVERSMDPELLATVIRSLGDSLADQTPLDRGRGVARALCEFVTRADTAVASAAVDALAHAVELGADPAGLVDALRHPDPGVVRGAMLKLDAIPDKRGELAQCLEHPSTDVRMMAAEMLAGAAPETARAPLSQRAQVETDRDVRYAIDSALAELRRRDPEPDSA